MVHEASRDAYESAGQGRNLSFTQTWAWGTVKEGVWKPVRLIVNDYPVQILLRKIPGLGRYFAYIPRLFSDDDFSLKILEETGSYLKKHHKISHIMYDPWLTENTFMKELASIGYTAAGSQIQPSNTNIIDLRIGIDELKNSLKSKTRNKINKPAKLGCQVTSFDNGQEALDRFWDIMQSIVRNTSYVSQDKEYFQKIWDAFSEGKMAKICIMHNDDEDLGGYFVLHNATTLWELFGGLNAAGRDIRGAGYFLKWACIEMAAASGITNYDQWGVAPKVDGTFDRSHPLARIGEFKEEFNGEHVSYLPQHVLVVDQFSYNIFRVGKKAQKLVVAVKKLG